MQASYTLRASIPEDMIPAVSRALTALGVGVWFAPKLAPPGQVQAPTPVPRAQPAGPRFVGGLKDKGITGQDLALEILTSERRVWPVRQVADRFVLRGFSRNSAQPALSELSQLGLVRRVGRSLYCTADLTVTSPR